MSACRNVSCIHVHVRPSWCSSEFENLAVFSCIVWNWTGCENKWCLLRWCALTQKLLVVISHVRCLSFNMTVLQHIVHVKQSGSYARRCLWLRPAIQAPQNRFDLCHEILTVSFKVLGFFFFLFFSFSIGRDIIFLKTGRYTFFTIYCHSPDGAATAALSDNGILYDIYSVTAGQHC